MKKILLALILFTTLIAAANEPASKLFVDLQKLQSLKRVLYIAAHPDDENTRALAWLSLGEKAETAYLSLTRGDGTDRLGPGRHEEDDFGGLPQPRKVKEETGGPGIFTR